MDDNWFERATEEGIARSLSSWDGIHFTCVETASGAVQSFSLLRVGTDSTGDTIFRNTNPEIGVTRELHRVIMFFLNHEEIGITPNYG